MNKETKLENIILDTFVQIANAISGLREGGMGCHFPETVEFDLPELGLKFEVPFWEPVGPNKPKEEECTAKPVKE